MDTRVKNIISEMTIDEKIQYCSGEGFWNTKKLEKYGVPTMMVSDGPHGLRTQSITPKKGEKKGLLGGKVSISAVCFPTACATACSFDTELIRMMGEALGDECQAENVGVILGPAVNIKRSPLGGRNFEYYSEDPLLAGEMGEALVRGIQSKNIGTSVKHFAVNNQETRRMNINAKVDERALREIYLSVFETIVKKSKPWTVMCSYNQVNGVFSSENDRLLNKILRDEWGFDGFTMTDWGAAHIRHKGIEAGMDLEMPSSCGAFDAATKKALEKGELSQEALDTAVANIMEKVFIYYDNKLENASYDKEAHHELAQKISEECAVLLKNDSDILPLKKGSKVAFIGEFADIPRYQGSGSSRITSFKVDSSLELAKDYAEVTFARGYETTSDTRNESLVAEAVKAAEDAETAVIFAGLTDIFESEGYDREHLNIPECQNYLIEQVAKVQKNTIVVLYNGSPILMPWLDQVSGVLEMYLGGQAVSRAAVRCIFGDVNPSGKLAETFPMQLSDNPSYLNFPGTKTEVDYKEGIYVGYRYYDKKNMKVLFPFGYGLSYTKFEYSDLQLNSNEFHEGDILKVKCTIKNIGAVEGKEVVQIYVQNPETDASSPIRELRGFKKVSLKPQESKTVEIELNYRAFAHYYSDSWEMQEGEYTICAAASSRDIRLCKTVTVKATNQKKTVVSIDTLVKDCMEDTKLYKIFENIIKNSTFYEDFSEINSPSCPPRIKMLYELLCNTPLRSIVMFSGGKFTMDQLEQMIMTANA